jgi:hypothetical protein
MNEKQRFDFLCQRDGYDKSVEWERRTADIYRAAALQAADPDTKGGAKGMEWATKYCDAAKECDVYTDMNFFFTQAAK